MNGSNATTSPAVGVEAFDTRVSKRGRLAPIASSRKDRGRASAGASHREGDVSVRVLVDDVAAPAELYEPLLLAWLTVLLISFFLVRRIYLWRQYDAMWLWPMLPLRKNSRSGATMRSSSTVRGGRKQVREQRPQQQQGQQQQHQGHQGQHEHEVLPAASAYSAKEPHRLDDCPKTPRSPQPEAIEMLAPRFAYGPRTPKQMGCDKAPLLSPSDLSRLSAELPAASSWRDMQLLYSCPSDGYSLSTFYFKVQEARGAPCMLVVRDDSGALCFLGDFVCPFLSFFPFLFSFYLFFLF